MQGEAGARSGVLAPGGGAVHTLVEVDNATAVCRGPGPHPVIDRVPQRECWGRGVSGGWLLTSPGCSRTPWESNIARSLMVSSLDRSIPTRVVTRHGPGVVVVGQGPGAEIMRQGSCSLKWGCVVVVEVGRRDEMGRMKGLLMVSMMSMMPDMVKRKTRIVVESG